jgi:hypothetical protein
MTAAGEVTRRGGRRPWRWIVPAVLALGLLVGGRWASGSRATPERALAAFAPGAGVLAELPFAQGVVLIGYEGAPPAAFTAWYVTPGLWGWRVAGVARVSANLTPGPRRADLTSFVAAGQTFVWGTAAAPARQVVFDHAGTTYTAPVGTFGLWHMVLPFAQATFRDDDWRVVLADGRAVPFSSP